jgi:nicotinamidase-related amidase
MTLERLDPQKTALIVVDVQERLAKAMPEAQLAELIRSARILIEAARLLKVPVFVTEQYPKGLGSTLNEVRELLERAGAQRFEKTAFSACGADGFFETVQRTGAQNAVVLGMESHVCVYQTVRDLVARGLPTYVPIDGVSSRREDHRETGLALCERAGAIRTTSETIVFDWLANAGRPEFKELSQLIR